MSEGSASKVSEGVQGLIRNKFRRSLQSLQVSADGEGLSGTMVPVDKIKNKKVPKVAKVILAEKENVVVRRSKRKTATVEKVNYAESPEELKASKSTSKIIAKAKPETKSKRGRSKAVKKNEQKTLINQTKLNFSPVEPNFVKNENLDSLQQVNAVEKILTSTTRESIDSGFEPNCGVCDQSPMNSTAILKSPALPRDTDISIITGDSAPLVYWRDLAEQRRLALEKVLYENELLHDQLTVLETENSQLKQLVKEAENLAQVLRAVIDENH